MKKGDEVDASMCAVIFIIICVVLSWIYEELFFFFSWVGDWVGKKKKAPFKISIKES